MDEMLEFRKNALQGVVTKQPLCKEYRMEWMKSLNDKEKLVTLVMRQQSCPYFAHHCYTGGGLSRDYILRNFGEYINGYTIKDADCVEGYTYGLYVGYDYNNEIVMNKDVAHIMWTVGVDVVVPKTKCPTIYVSNKSDITLIGDGYNNARVYLFDESTVTINDIDEESEITVYKYSDKCCVKKGKFCLGKVKEFNKELRL